MARIDLLPKSDQIRSPSFCDCIFPKSNEITTYKGDIHELVECKCGEEDYHHIEWLWDKETAHPECFIDGQNVTFHPTFSQGTSIIRGNKRLQPHMIHYWEIRIITSMSGTDVMFGIGTDKVNLSEYHFQFISALGINENSWGYSYRGICQHKGVSHKYGNKITQGCILGIYVDLVKGYLEFYLNRKSLGIAYKNIPIDKNIKLYPMVCSTSAKSSIRLINSTSHYDTLQFQTIREISKRPMQIHKLRQMPGLRYLLNEYWFLCPPIKYSHRSKKNDLPLEDEVVLSRKSKKMKLKENELLLSATATATTTTKTDDIVDIYENAHIIINDRNESDEEISSEDYLFCLF